MLRYEHLASILNSKCELWRNERCPIMNELGQRPIMPVKVAVLRCGIVPQTGTLLAGRVGDTALTKTTHKIIIRWYKDIKSDDWLIIDGQRYNIIYSLDPYNNHERLELFCEVII